MKRTILFTSLFLFWLISCSNQEKSRPSSNIIDIEKGLQNIAKLNVSDFGKTIRYIPLETTDDGLIGKNPIAKVLKNHIIIEANNSCLLFDKNNGRFITTIGHTGQDPEAYSSASCWTDEKEAFLYFIQQPNKLIKYNLNGTFSGRTTYPTPPGLASYYLLTETETIGYYTGLNNSPDLKLAFFGPEGNLRDSIPALHQNINETIDEIAGISVTRGSDTYGNWAKTGAIIIDYKNGHRYIMTPSAPVLWKNKEEVRFKENFVDTIYTITGTTLTPAFVFHTGKWHWPKEDQTNKEKSAERIFVADVSENNEFIFFQCIKGVYTDEPIVYNGLYHKKTDVTQISRHNDPIEDDLTGFMPFKPQSISTTGEFVSLIEGDALLEWLEEHPEAAENEKLSFLKDVSEDMNPVIVLVY